MPLVQTALSVAIFRALNGQLNDRSSSSVPIPTDRSLDALSSAYHDWVLSGFPVPPFAFSVQPTSSVLKSSLAVPMFGGWGPGLSAYWLASSLSGPGFIPANPLSPAAAGSLPGLSAKLTAELASILITASSDGTETIQGAADKLSSKLFTFTTSLSYMMTTTTVPPTTVIVPVI